MDMTDEERDIQVDRVGCCAAEVFRGKTVFAGPDGTNGVILTVDGKDFRVGYLDYAIARDDKQLGDAIAYQYLRSVEPVANG